MYIYVHILQMNIDKQQASLLMFSQAFFVASPLQCQTNKMKHESVIRLFMWYDINLANQIKTHDSESRGQEEAQQRDHCRDLFTRSTTLKLANVLAKPPLKLSLSYYRPTTFLLYRINKPRMEEIAPPFLSTSHCEIYAARCATTHDEPSFPAQFARLLDN